jgi:tetratricopeptide (TPR) repeat protein
VADLLADLIHLPFREGSVDAIEADQVLEHFDTAHATMVLDECRRVLKPGGTLTVESPDLEKALEKLVAADSSRHDGELQWVFGLDSPGLQHKTGFTKRSLRGILEGSSLKVLRFETSRTHTYEPGLRAICRKDEHTDDRTEIIAGAISILVRGNAFDDSFILVPLREELKRIIGLATERSNDGGIDLVGLLARACVLNAEVADAVHAALKDKFGEGGDGERALKIIRLLSSERLHEKAFTLWKKSVRRNGNKQDFEEFSERLANDVARCLTDDREGLNHLKYVLNLDPTPIRILEYRLAMVEGQKAMGLGLRMYTRRDYSGAMESFREALAIDNGNFQAAVNLARLLAHQKGSISSVKDVYSRALRSAPKRLRAQIEEEVCMIDEMESLPNSPYVIPT